MTDSTATTSAAAPAIPLIAVVGTTGAGKSDLAIHLAQQLGGEVINSDALQVYRALDTVTNKVSREDRAKVPHHLMDLRDAHTDAPYSVRDFERDASALIHDLYAAHKVPLVVGGTHYYLQYLLWGDDASNASDTTDPTPNVDESQYLPAAVRASLDDPAALHAHLASVDPTAAARWHPNDTRRVRRTLERHYARLACGITEPETSVPRGLRYKPLVFWVYAEGAVLDARLDARVDGMVGRGLLDELRHVRGLALETVNADKTGLRGVFQAIGYKELAPYLDAVDRVAAEAPVVVAEGVDKVEKAKMASVNLEPAVPEVADGLEGGETVESVGVAEQTDAVVRDLARRYRASVDTAATWSEKSAELDRLWQLNLATMKTATRQYARRQLQWLRNKLVPRLRRDGAPVYLLDASDPIQFASRALDPATNIARAFLAGTPLPDPATIFPDQDEALRVTAPPSQTWQVFRCDVCDRDFRGDAEWDAHRKSRAHRALLKRKRKADAKDAMVAKRVAVVAAADMAAVAEATARSAGMTTAPERHDDV
ncbi:hypothetical protein GGF31_006819 [Allomyces arbusculus]|nr:hypothetical protein GGF31_006819 [Allomyces arbusculus]